jgi:tungstate transport system permease protein
MNFLWNGVSQAWHLIVSGNPYLWRVTWVTLKVAGVSTALSLVIGLPIGLTLGLGRFRGRRAAVALANFGMVLPPVVVGLVLALLMFPLAPLGRFRLAYTLNGVYLAQTVLSLPILIALTSSAVQAVPTGLRDQARAFGAGRLAVWALAVREARIGILTATIAAAGSALSEVGAVVLVGGNIEGRDQTLASAALEQVNAGNYSASVAIGIILLGLMAIIIAALTIAQQREQRGVRIRPPS